MSPRFPNVPLYPGVPAVLRSVRRVGDAIAAQFGPDQPPAPELTADALAALQPANVTWGLYTVDGAIALAVDSVVSLEPRQEYRISDYPVEEGAFRSYNKVQTPAEIRLTVTKGGSDAARSIFLATIEMLKGTTTLYTVVAPDSVFPGYSVVASSYRRTAQQGVALLMVELTLEEVRQTAASAFTTARDTTPPKDPGGANTVTTGPVQAIDPTDAQLDALIEVERRAKAGT